MKLLILELRGTRLLARLLDTPSLVCRVSMRRRLDITASCWLSDPGTFVISASYISLLASLITATRKGLVGGLSCLVAESSLGL
jgi:hypothetical protein